MAKDDLDDLRARLARLEDERCILDALYRYGHAIDYGLESDWVDCFTESGSFIVMNPPDKPAAALPKTDAAFPIAVHGRTDLAAFIRRHTRAPEVYHKHLLIEPRITVDGDQATVQSYYMMVRDRDGQREIFSFGRYLDRLIRCPDGRWRLTERRAEAESRGQTGPVRGQI